MTLDTPVGTPVVVLRDNGQEYRTRTRSKPWWLIESRRRRRGGGRSETKRLVVLVDGITGCYDCSRIRLISERQLELFGAPRP